MAQRKDICFIIDEKLSSNNHFNINNQSIVRNNCQDGVSRTVSGTKIVSTGIHSWNIRIKKCKCWCNNKSIGIRDTSNIFSQYKYYLSGNVAIPKLITFHPLKVNDIITVVIDSNNFYLLFFVNMVKISTINLPFEMIDIRQKCGPCGGSGWSYIDEDGDPRGNDICYDCDGSGWVGDEALRRKQVWNQGKSYRLVIAASNDGDSFEFVDFNDMLIIGYLKSYTTYLDGESMDIIELIQKYLGNVVSQEISRFHSKATFCLNNI